MLKKVFTVILAFAMAVTLLASCKEEVVEEGIVPSRRTLTINGKEEKFPYVMEVNGQQVSLDEYLFYFTQLRQSLDYGDITLWENEQYAALLLERTERFILQGYAVDDIAAEYGVTMTEEEKQLAIDELQELVDYYGSAEEFIRAMQGANATDVVYVEFLNRMYLYDKLQDTLYGADGAFAEDFNTVLERATTDFVHVKHILIPYGESPAEALALAEEIQQRAVSGEDFDDLRAQYDADAAGQPPYGYYFTYGYMVPEFEEMAYSLEVGEISTPVETQFGYHVIIRLPLEEADVREHYLMFSQGTTVAFEALINERIDALDVKYASNYDLLTVKNILNAFALQ